MKQLKFLKEIIEFELMHTVSAYPFEDKLANLNLIPVLRKRYNCKVGYSGHRKVVWLYLMRLLL